MPSCELFIKLKPNLLLLKRRVLEEGPEKEMEGHQAGGEDDPGQAATKRACSKECSG